MPEEKSLPSPAPKMSISKSIRVLILSSSTSLVEAIAFILKDVGLKIDWHQVATQAEYDNYLSKIGIHSQLNSNNLKDPLTNYHYEVQPSLILWDGDLTQITLNEAIASISSHNPYIPLLVVNGKLDVSTAVAAIKAGAIDYITKDEPRLPEAIFSALSQSDRHWHQDRETESERQLEKLIFENPDGIIVVDEKGVVKFINLAALELLNKSGEDLIGESLGFPVVNGDYLEVDIPRSPTEILVAQMRVSNIQWQRKTAFVVSLRDITQLKRAEEERAKLLQEAQAANRAKDEFLAVLSHELRTPLNPIVGWSQLLSAGNLSESQIKKGAEIIQRNAMLQTQLIEDILDVSRIIQGKLQLERSPLDLITIIKNAIDTVSLAAQAKSIAIETNLEENIDSVQGDPTRIQQVIWNLLSNAIKFTPNHGKVKIDLSSTDSAASQEYATEDKLPIRYAQIQIIDSGKGIQSEFLPYVFDYFRQAESTKSRSQGGLGLGLAIVRRIVELHGGEVTADSEGLGKGATFTVSLPIVNNPSQFNLYYNENK
jgi:signal transduction histidine kinase